MNRITKAQFISLMMIGDVFAVFCLTGSISMLTAAGFGAGCLIQLILALPIAAVYRKGRTIADCGKAASAAVLVCLILWGGLLFSMLRSTSEVIYIPYESGKYGYILIAALIAVVCVYISSSGIKALARSAVIAAAVGAVCLLIVMVSALIRSDYRNVTVPAENSLFSEIVRGLAASGGMGGFVVMLGCCKGGIPKTAVTCFIVRGIIMTAMILTGILVCGGIMSITDFPIASAAQLSQPFPVQRIDSLFLIVFSVFAVYAIAVQAVSADLVMAQLFPCMKKYRCTLALALMAGAGILFGGRTFYSLPFAIAPAGLLLFVPLCYLIKMCIDKGRVRK